MIDSMAKFMSSDRTPKWLVDGVIQEGALTMLFGESGVGKSFTALDWALCVATGQNWMGRPVAQGPVLYLPSEGYDGLQARIYAWCLKHGISTDEIADIPLHIGSFAMAIGHEGEFLEMMEEIDFIQPPPVLVVIDTLTGFSDGLDQNSSKDMATFASSCSRINTRTDATILVVHHSGHKEKGRSKGAVDFWAACDTVAAMVRSGRDGALAIRCNKSRNGPPFDDIHMKLETCEPSAVLVEASAPAINEKSALTKGDRVFRDIVTSAPISEADAKARFNEVYGGSPGANRNAWSRALKKAISAELIDFDSETGSLSPRTHTTHN